MNHFAYLIIVLNLLALGSEKALAQSGKFDRITFYKDYFPGTYDTNGNYMGSTETMSLVSHKGKLYAGMSNWMDYPITMQSEGTQVLRKDSPDSPWQVDTSLGYTSLRSDALQSIYFTKDYQGNRLADPVNILLGGFTRIVPPLHTSIWVRNDSTGRWVRNEIGVFTTRPGHTGIRSFSVHTDKVTGMQWLFCGLAAGLIVKAGFDPTQEGFLRIDDTPELANAGRVVAMTVCNGDLYASTGVGKEGGRTYGGIYKRIDGEDPSWELVYQWPAHPSVGEDQNVMRGISCVPDPKGSSNKVIIGARNLSALIQVIEPFNNHNVYTELPVTEYFSDAWFGGDPWPYRDYSIAAYNNFTPDILNDQQVWWTSLAIDAPNQQSPPDNGAYFLLRHLNGEYQWGYIYDPDNPVPPGESLRATRTICKSPFPEDRDSVYYFGGYDCLGDTSNNTAWIYKGVVHKIMTGSDSVADDMPGLILFPNPAYTEISLKNLPAGSVVQILNSSGMVMYTSGPANDPDMSITIADYADGVYFVTVEYKGKVTQRKFIVSR